MSEGPDLPSFDLAACRGRIGPSGEPRPDAETLRAVHLAHALAISFENLDPLLGVAPGLGREELSAKLLGWRRGGYCYEHDTLFDWALEAAIGYPVTRPAARVVPGAERFTSRPRTQMDLLVHVPGEAGAAGTDTPYLVDVGFGAVTTVLEPLPLVANREPEAAGRRHPLVRAPHDGPPELWVPETYLVGKGEWQAQYAFTVEPFGHQDFEVVNWFIATSPRSLFSRRLYAQRTAADHHLVLDDRRLSVTNADGTATERELVDDAEARRVLSEDFGITAPDGMALLLRPPGDGPGALGRTGSSAAGAGTDIVRRARVRRQPPD
ncbi:arylamine N-acetyltransferase [Streptomyces sp. MUM 203J]|uniref:arylamine N-acetyltransferase family protein n=1 Tax=Streptomyces sp. MUM 203J TaxID=2791990 RepID=UPI001F038A5D|nr:arylamine N-acetyltransferase [Streptomyces sp. MUM 203J]MCH0541927.1 arylamine N-acetyltransferase [Streptomyces sp. MUM 203J]